MPAGNYPAGIFIIEISYIFIDSIHNIGLKGREFPAAKL